MSNTQTLPQLDAYLKQHEIEHFGAHELVKHYDPRWTGDSIIVPPPVLWANIIPTLQLADAIRDELDRPVTVISGYRDPDYNEVIHGSSNSQHVYFRALDLSIGDDPNDYLMLIEVASRWVRQWRVDGYEVGLGIYDDSDAFVHIDCGFASRMWTG